MPLEIVKWNLVFENSQSRKLVNLTWVPIPNKHDSLGFRRLMQNPDGVAIYGAWCLLLQLASKSKRRGVVESADGVADSPETMALRTGASADCFRKAIPILKQIGWLSGDIETSPETPGEPPEIVAESPIEGKGRKGTTAPETTPETAASTPKQSKPRTEAQQHAIGAMWIDMFKSWKNAGYDLLGPDLGAIKRLGVAYPEDKRLELKNKMRACLSGPEPYGRGWTLWEFEKRRNDFSGAAPKKEPEIECDESQFEELGLEFPAEQSGG